MRMGKGLNVEGLRAFNFTLPDHIDQRAIGDYTRVTYINIQQADSKKNGEKAHSWELDR